MKPTNMPVINAFLKRINADQLLIKNTLFVCVQHLLYTTIDLFDALICLGANPQHIFLLGKVYSTHPRVGQILTDKGIQVIPSTPLKRYGEFSESLKKDIGLMWEKIQTYLLSHKIDKIIILDDGGLCLANTPTHLKHTYPVIGVEQTSSGLFHARYVPFPIIEVASSAAKQHLEAPMIAEAVEAKLASILPLAESKSLSCGVVGLGVIGKAIVSKLLQYGHSVYTYDTELAKNTTLEYTQPVNHIRELLVNAEYIFGCTGTDIFKGIDCEAEWTSSKVLVSCSSQDIEFYSLLKVLAKKQSTKVADPLETIQFQLTNGISINLLHGGFPINLDNSGYSVPAGDIQMTRGLLLAGCVQAATLINHYHPGNIPAKVMLCPWFQHLIARRWFSLGSYCTTQIPLQCYFEQTDWIEQQSGGKRFGEFCTVNLMEAAFCQTP